MKINTSIIALDMDDTLLKDDLSISSYTVDIIRKVVKKNIYVTMCSGRSDNAILKFVRRLDIAGFEEGRYIIAQNGASITDLHKRKAIFNRYVDSSILITSYKKALERGLSAQVYDEASLYAPKKTSWVDHDISLSHLDLHIVDNFELFLKKDHPKMVIPGDPSILLELEKDLKTLFGNECVIFISKPYFLEIMPKGTGKGESLLWLAQTLGLDPTTIMAFGDSMNDESMIQLAHHSVCMKNGREKIKKQARYVTKYTNEEDGVARFIEKYVL